jgi:DNA-binding MarR family transcriptional regulator
MKIEEELKLNNIKDPNYLSILNVIYTANYLHQQLQNKLRDYKLSSQQLNILRILNDIYPDSTRVSEIQRKMLYPMSNASRLVEKLRAKGLVTRTLNKQDRRSVKVKIASKGMKLLEEIEKINLEKEFYNINKKEAAQLNNLLDKLRG